MININLIRAKTALCKRPQCDQVRNCAFYYLCFSVYVPFDSLALMALIRL